MLNIISYEEDNTFIFGLPQQELYYGESFSNLQNDIGICLPFLPFSC